MGAVRRRASGLEFDRLTADDMMTLVGESDLPPLHVGAVLVLGNGSGIDPTAVRSALAQRLPAVPRLRRRLILLPFGSGRPLWIDDADFDIGDHFVIHPTSVPVSHQGLLDLAAESLTSQLPPDRPLWRATFVAAAEGDRAALIVVFHHVLADGEAGLALLAELLTSEPAPFDPSFPRPRPARRDVVFDALRDRLRSVRRVSAVFARLVVAAVELGPTLRRSAPSCSLNQPTGPIRSLRAVNTSLSKLVDVAHRHGTTVNDVILTVVAEALHDLLAVRDEAVPYFVVSVPFANRRPGGVHGLGNHSGVVPIRIPDEGPFEVRLAAVAANTSNAKRHQRGASTVILTPAFRLLDRLGLYKRFVDRQRLIHTFVSNIRGPNLPVEVFGSPLVELIPLSVTSGNVTVAFTALSYDGRLVITVNADPLTCPELDLLGGALRSHFDSLDLSAIAN